MPGAGGVEHLAQVDSRHFLGAGQWLGRAVDYHCTAIGKVFLAFGRAPMPAGRCAARAGDDHRPGAAARRARGRARSGFATAVDELEPGLAAIAAPVRGARGDVVAALSISGPTLRMTPRADRASCEPILIEEARR